MRGDVIFFFGMGGVGGSLTEEGVWELWGGWGAYWKCGNDMSYAVPCYVGKDTYTWFGSGWTRLRSFFWVELGEGVWLSGAFYTQGHWSTSF